MWLQILIGIFLILHGMVHWVYAAPQEKEPDANKPFGVLTGRWLVKKAGLNQSVALKLGIALMILATVGFAVSGIALLCSQGWWSISAIPTAAVSLAFLALYWDRWMFGGALLNIGIIVLALLWEF
jgi:hypothetical protein